jgi:hypothetical protein
MRSGAAGSSGPRRRVAGTNRPTRDSSLRFLLLIDVRIDRSIIRRLTVAGVAEDHVRARDDVGPVFPISVVVLNDGATLNGHRHGGPSPRVLDRGCCRMSGVILNIGARPRTTSRYSRVGPAAAARSSRGPGGANSVAVRRPAPSPDQRRAPGREVSLFAISTASARARSMFGFGSFRPGEPRSLIR